MKRRRDHNSRFRCGHEMCGCGHGEHIDVFTKDVCTGCVHRAAMILKVLILRAHIHTSIGNIYTGEIMDKPAYIATKCPVGVWRVKDVCTRARNVEALISICFVYCRLLLLCREAFLLAPSNHFPRPMF